MKQPGTQLRPRSMRFERSTQKKTKVIDADPSACPLVRMRAPGGQRQLGHKKMTGQRKERADQDANTTSTSRKNRIRIMQINLENNGHILNFRRKNGGIIRPKGTFSKHFKLIHLAGMRVLKNLSQKKTFLSSLFISISLHFS